MDLITYPLNNINYTAEDAELFHCTRTSGVWAKNSFPLSATGANNKVTVGKGIAWINNEEFSGKVVALKESKSLDLGVADSTYPRIDIIAIQYNANNNSTDVIIKKGTPATNPVRPAIVRTGAVYELYLASIYRPAGATTVTASNITDLKMDENVCGLMADSVTQIDTGAINSQVQDFILSLEKEIESVKNQTDVLLKSGLYPVGSVLMTGNYENPSAYLGGTWECFDKNLAYTVYDSKNDNSFFTPSSNIQGWSSYVTVEGHNATFRVEIYSAVQIGETEIIWGTFNFKKMGFNGLYYTAQYVLGAGDNSNVIVLAQLDYSTGEFATVDVNPKTDGGLIGVGDGFTVYFTVPISTQAMHNAYCDKFYWKRIE